MVSEMKKSGRVYMEGHRVVYEWIVPESMRHDISEDIAEAYRVVENKMASCGILVYAKYKGKWEVNPWSTRALIRQLVTELSNEKKRNNNREPKGS